VRLEGEHFDEMHFWIVDSAVVKRQHFSQLLHYFTGFIFPASFARVATFFSMYYVYCTVLCTKLWCIFIDERLIPSWTTIV
jgi:hypothetical protein